MCSVKRKTFCLDNDTVEVLYHYNQDADIYFGDYPDFSEEPRYTPNGRPWVNAMNTDCPYSTEEYGDCGTCDFFLRENPRDLIGVCRNEAHRKEQRL